MSVSALSQLMDVLTSDSASVLCVRSKSNYAKFLQLYETIGHAPQSEDARSAWQSRSIQTWSRLDNILPETYSGGMCDGELVSGWGTLPMSPTIVYGHSACMLKTLEGAATMYPQTLLSLGWMDRFREAQYWAGSYAGGKRFVVLFQQRPLGVSIPGQIEFYALRCSPWMGTTTESAIADCFVDETTLQEETLLNPDQLEVYRHLSSSHPILAGLHGVQAVTARCAKTGRPLALILLQTSLPELTAINIFAAPWVFPLQSDPSWPAFVRRLRQIEELRTRRLEVIVSRNEPAIGLSGEPNLQSVFWAMTPRASLPMLRLSFHNAFQHLLSRYPENQIKQYLETLSCPHFEPQPRSSH